MEFWFLTVVPKHFLHFNGAIINFYTVTSSWTLILRHIFNTKNCNSQSLVCHISICLFIQLRTAALRLIVWSWLNVPTFATRRLHACHHARAPGGGRWNFGREMSGNFAEITTFKPFRNLDAVRHLTASGDYTSNNPPRMQNQRLLVQF
jgi:hypothetical protein